MTDNLFHGYRIVSDEISTPHGAVNPKSLMAKWGMWIQTYINVTDTDGNYLRFPDGRSYYDQNHREICVFTVIRAKLNHLKAEKMKRDMERNRRKR